MSKLLVVLGKESQRIREGWLYPRASNRKQNDIAERDPEDDGIYSRLQRIEKKNLKEYLASGQSYC